MPRGPKDHGSNHAGIVEPTHSSEPLTICLFALFLPSWPSHGQGGDSHRLDGRLDGPPHTDYQNPAERLVLQGRHKAYRTRLRGLQGVRGRRQVAQSARDLVACRGLWSSLTRRWWHGSQMGLTKLPTVRRCPDIEFNTWSTALCLLRMVIRDRLIRPRARSSAMVPIKVRIRST